MPRRQDKSRYIALEETLPTSHTPNMIGRIVRDMGIPLHEYVPDPRIANINPKDIIKDISEKTCRNI